MNFQVDKTAKNAVCTIVSRNYLAYANVLAHSVKQWNPALEFHLLIVDKKDDCLKIPGINITWVQDLNIPGFEKISFKYNILELNTNVKPSFLLHLLKRFEKVAYLDPDILVCAPLTEIYAELQDFSITLTPHLLSLSAFDAPENEISLLNSGTYNLGFIGVNSSEEAIRFLTWWEARCLYAAFDETENGLFVDQKWINLIHSAFDSVKILRNRGMNVAYWNYHERPLSLKDGVIMISDVHPLIFFHFSGIVGANDILSKYNPDLKITAADVIFGLLTAYKKNLDENNHFNLSKIPYGFGAFSNGKLINGFCRRVYASNYSKFDPDPFDESGDFYKFAIDNKLVSSYVASENSINTRNYREKPQFKVLQKLFKLTFFLLGVSRYELLLKFLRKSTTLRKQTWLFKF